MTVNDNLIIFLFFSNWRIFIFHFSWSVIPSSADGHLSIDSEPLHIIHHWNRKDSRYSFFSVSFFKKLTAKINLSFSEKNALLRTEKANFWKQTKFKSNFNTKFTYPKRLFSVWNRCSGAPIHLKIKIVMRELSFSSKIWKFCKIWLYNVSYKEERLKD